MNICYLFLDLDKLCSIFFNCYGCLILGCYLSRKKCNISIDWKKIWKFKIREKKKQNWISKWWKFQVNIFRISLSKKKNLELTCLFFLCGYSDINLFSKTSLDKFNFRKSSSPNEYFSFGSALDQLISILFWVIIINYYLKVY